MQHQQSPPPRLSLVAVYQRNKRTTNNKPEKLRKRMAIEMNGNGSWKLSNRMATGIVVLSSQNVLLA